MFMEHQRTNDGDIPWKDLQSKSEETLLNDSENDREILSSSNPSKEFTTFTRDSVPSNYFSRVNENDENDEPPPLPSFSWFCNNLVNNDNLTLPPPLQPLQSKTSSLSVIEPNFQPKGPIILPSLPKLL
ncbi:hypothetical protein RclHR1_04840010 [Rhizophagus clarus]|uniref:Uncharacterized protein n=1 Tax=Rhizophagus clarus TaxID=94130 RepID=A0A2Z6SCS4_9GLOM|nr:hypothetical protein RclHR1_04840010 [Rhizophagus clarus]GET03656.1 hypothetical protein RCL_jg22609.t1 [Rhizophagus clarus]